MHTMAILPVFATTAWNTTAPPDAVSPPWIKSTYAPSDPSLLYDLVGEAVEHYTGRIRHYEFTNEPVWIPFPGGNLSSSYGYTVADYLTLLRGAYPAMKAADPDCKVLGGLSIQAEMALGDTFITSGGLDYCDIYNLHPYPCANAAPEVFIGYMNRILNVMDAHGGRKPIWATETGYYAEDDLPWTPWVAPPDHHSANNLTNAERLAADYGTRHAIILLAHNVEKIFYHQGIEGEVNSGSWPLDNPLLGDLATPDKFFISPAALADALGPKPLYGTPLVKPAAVGGQTTDSVYGYAFDRESGGVLAVWTFAETGANWRLSVPENARARDAVGNPLSVTPVPLRSSPVYILSNTLSASQLASSCSLSLATEPYDYDLDDDGLMDSYEICYDGDCDTYDPYNVATNAGGGDLDIRQADSDGDGLSDLAELAHHHTNPFSTDSDDDGMEDGWEVVNDLDPLFDDSDLDADADRVSNFWEHEFGTDPNDARSFSEPAALSVDTQSVQLDESAPTAVFNVLNRGELDFDWLAEADVPFIELQPAAGSSPAEVSVTATDFTQDRTDRIMVTNVGVTEDTETIHVTVKSSGGSRLACAASKTPGAPSTPIPYGDVLVLVMVMLATVACRRKILSRRTCE